MSEPAEVDVKSVSWWPPSWLVMTSFFALCLVAIGVGVAWYEIVDERSERREECEQSVRFREDNRAMWLELFEVFPDAAMDTGLAADLEALLPPLACDGTTLIPARGR